MASAHVDLQRRHDEFGHWQRGISRVAHLYKFVGRFVATNVHIARLLFAHGCFPRVFIATRCFIVMANKNAGGIRQRQNLLDRRE